MKKRFMLSLTLLLCFSMLLAACSQNTSNSPNVSDSGNNATDSGQGEQAPETNASPNEVSITYTNAPSKDNAEQYQAELDFNEKFMDKYPHITVNMDSFRYEPRAYVARVEGGNAATITDLWMTELQMVKDRGYAADITELIENWEYKDQVNPGLLSLGEVGGRYYALPINGYSMGLLYNKELFVEAGIVDEQGNPRIPETWEEFAETAAKLTDRQRNISGFSLLTSKNQGGWNFLNWGWQAGGEFLEQAEDGSWKAIYNSPEIVQALQFLKDLRWKYDALQYETLFDVEQMWQALAADQTAMAIFTGDWLGSLNNRAGGLDKFGMAPLPEGPAGRVNQAGGQMLVFDKNATQEELEAAFEFATYKFFNTDNSVIRELYEGRVAAGKLVGLPEFALWQPGSENQLQLDAIKDELANIPVENFLAYQATMLDHARPEPPVLAQELYNEMDNFLQQIMVDKNADPQTLLNESVNRFQQQLNDIPSQ